MAWYSIFCHFWPFKPLVPTYKWPHCPISVFINKIDVTWYHCNDICKGKATPSNYYPVFPTFAQKFNFWPFFNNCACSWATHWSHLRYIDKTRCCCNDICGEKATPGYYHPILPPFAWQLNFWPFSAIFYHLCLVKGDCLIPPLLLLTKMLLLGAVALISTERELFQAITTPFSRHLPENGIFWLF